MEFRKSSLEALEINNPFWKDKSVFLTGHTGFKGSWLSIYLNSLGAKVTGFSLSPPTNPSLFELAGLKEKIHKSIEGDIRDFNHLQREIESCNPDIIFHLAAQPIVKVSYENPIDTYTTNVIGTANLLESIRTFKLEKKKRVVINVTTDKVYENNEWVWSYRENERLGGKDPYSSSKACSELVTSSYESSFFPRDKTEEHLVSIASARAGNVIGGGDFASFRLIPDMIKSIIAKKDIEIRNPYSVRPWQHVLEPLSGYIVLAEKMYSSKGEFNGSWNFGPEESDAMSVMDVVNRIKNIIDSSILSDQGSSLFSPKIKMDTTNHPPEAINLKLDISKAKQYLGWKPRWNIHKALFMSVDWVDSFQKGNDINKLCNKQIIEYSSLRNH